jgi:arylsulfatase A-like enzyme
MPVLSTEPPPSLAPLPPPSSRAAVVALTALLIPGLCVGYDIAVRGSLFPRAGLATYAVGALLSVLVWGLGMEAARHPRRAVRAFAIAFLGFTAAFGIGLQLVVRTLTHAYLGRRALVLALGIPSIGRSGYMTHYALPIGAACFVPAAIVMAVVMVRRRRLGVRTARPGLTAGAAVLAVVATVFAPIAVQGIQCLPPDVLWLNGTGGPLLYLFGFQPKPKALPVGKHEALPETPPAPAGAPPIVLILGESVRRDAVCTARTPGCSLSPHLDAAAPDRIGFARAYTTASCTELAASALWTGLSVTAPPEVAARAPLLWDWAKARGYRTAYLTSQNLLFQQSDHFLRGSRIDLLREARDRVVDAPIDDGSPDEDTTAEALRFVEAEGAPAFVVVHHANTHVPYRQAPGFTPHAEGEPMGRYRNGIAYNDFLLGELLAGLRRGERGRRAIVLYTSDHGEAFGEHGASYHCFDLYAEQTDVPAWLDAPPGTLPETTMARLRGEAAVRPVAMRDLTATVVDLLGGFDAPALRAQAAALPGQSLLREAPGPEEVLLWNCPPTRECGTDSFGVVSFPLKLHYVGHQQRYACHDLEADPAELSPLAPSRCAPLRALLDRTFGSRPEAQSH